MVRVFKKNVPFIRNVFCSTGEGGGVDPTCPAGGSKTSASLVSELNEAGFAVLPSIQELDKDLVQLLHKELMDLKKDFPGVEKNFGSILQGDLPDGVPLTYRSEGGSKKLIIDSKQMQGEGLKRTLRDVEKSQKSGWLASGDGIRGILVHELAHAVDKTPFNTSFNWQISKAQIYLKKNPPTKKQLSGYAAQAGPNQKEEIFAEAFAAWRTGLNPSPWQKKFNDLMNGRGK